MTNLISTALGAPLPLAVLVLGFLAMVAIVGIRVARAKNVAGVVDELLALAMDGRADEARIRARQSGRVLKPLLEVLGGEVGQPARRPMMSDAPWIVLLVLPLLVFVGYCLTNLQEAHTRVAVSVALLLGTAVLLPACLASAIAIFEVGRRTTRAVRGACVVLLIQNVKNEFEAERADVIRRGRKKDPRAEA